MSIWSKSFRTPLDTPPVEEKDSSDARSLLEALEEDVWEVVLEGDYRAKILGMGEIKQSKSSSRFVMPIAMKIDGKEVRYWLSGFLSAITIIKVAEPYFLNKEVDVRIKHRRLGSARYVDVMAIWSTLQ